MRTKLLPRLLLPRLLWTLQNALLPRLLWILQNKVQVPWNVTANFSVFVYTFASDSTPEIPADANQSARVLCPENKAASLKAAVFAPGMQSLL